MQTQSDTPAVTADVAIIGGGIVGIMTALGLLRRGMRITIYERAKDFTESGAAFAFTGVARECMRKLDPRVLEALSGVSEENRHAYNRYWDGFNPTTKEAAEGEHALLFKVSARELSYCGCLRSQLLQEMVRLLPDGLVKFGKRLQTYSHDEMSKRTVLHFADGTVEDADAGS